MRHKAVLCLWLIACLAWAQEVVVFEFQADSGMRLSQQVEDAVLEYTAVVPMSRRAYVSEASRAGVANAQTAVGFSRTAARLPKVLIAVWGKVEGNSVDIFIWDRMGAQLWNRPLPLRQGLLTQELSQRLAKAIAVAVDIQAEGSVASGDSPGAAPTPWQPPAEPGEASMLPAVADEKEAPEILTMDLRPQHSAPSMPFLRIALLGTSSWRSLCVRPGRDSCLAFEKLPEGPPQGNKNFSSGAYGGAFLQAEYFPLVSLAPSVWKGLGLRAEAGYGRVRKDFRDAASQKEMLMIREVHWSTEALFRHFFLEPSSGGPGLQASVSLGYAEKRFESEDRLERGLLFPDTRRRSMGMGAEAELSWPFFRLSLYGNVFIQPRPGRAVREEYGHVRSKGYRVGGAVSGNIYGPVGYKVDMSWNVFKDTKDSSADEKWAEGGILRETYLSLRGGLLLEF